MFYQSFLRDKIYYLGRKVPTQFLKIWVHSGRCKELLWHNNINNVKFGKTINLPKCNTININIIQTIKAYEIFLIILYLVITTPVSYLYREMALLRRFRLSIMPLPYHTRAKPRIAILYRLKIYFLHHLFPIC